MPRDPRPLVVLDPGHGGIDTGTKAPNGECEKDIVLDFAMRLRDRIEQAGKYRVLMTRSDDTFVPLADRVQIARNAGAALFVSIHADSLPHKEGDAQGATVYTLSETASDSASARLAEEENRADVIAGVDLKSEPDDVAGILIDLAQRETKTFSVQFAHKLVGEMKEATRLHKEPVKSAGFRVLQAPRTCPRCWSNSAMCRTSRICSRCCRTPGATIPPTPWRRPSTAISPPMSPAPRAN